MATDTVKFSFGPWISKYSVVERFNEIFMAAIGAGYWQFFSNSLIDTVNIRWVKVTCFCEIIGLAVNYIAHDNVIRKMCPYIMVADRQPIKFYFRTPA